MDIARQGASNQDEATFPLVHRSVYFSAARYPARPYGERARAGRKLAGSESILPSCVWTGRGIIHCSTALPIHPFIPPPFMILRSLPRPQRQLQAALSSLTPSKQRCAAVTNTSLHQRSSPAAQRDEWERPGVSARRGLATQPTGFEGHRLPALPHDATYAEHGVDGFLSPEGFDLAWTQYQSMMIEKLNTMTISMRRGLPSEYMSDLGCLSRAC